MGRRLVWLCVWETDGGGGSGDEVAGLLSNWVGGSFEELGVWVTNRRGESSRELGGRE